MNPGSLKMAIVVWGEKIVNVVNIAYDRCRLWRREPRLGSDITFPRKRETASKAGWDGRIMNVC
jgi:hypothetical protein